MKYYKQLDENHNVVCLFAFDYEAEEDEFFVQITEAEYLEIKQDIIDHREEPLPPGDNDPVSSDEFMAMVEEIL